MLITTLACKNGSDNTRPLPENKAVENNLVVSDIQQDQHQDIFVQIDSTGVARVIVELNIQREGDLSPTLIEDPVNNFV